MRDELCPMRELQFCSPQKIQAEKQYDGGMTDDAKASRAQTSHCNKKHREGSGSH